MNTRHLWRLLRRPIGDILDDDFQYCTEALPELQEGHFLLRVRYLSLDPAMRVWIGEQEQYSTPVAIGGAIRGVVVGVVVASRKDGVSQGAVMQGMGEWADYVISDGDGFSSLPAIPGIGLAETFGTLNLVGPTAYFGLLEAGRLQAGETLVVSAAAGGVGQIVGQIGKIKGCHVIGIAGGPEKCSFVENELGFDACIDYKNTDVGDELDRLAPNGVDISFEQVGGSVMAAVLSRMKMFGRVALCGMVSSYNNAGEPAVPGQWSTILMRRLTVQGFIVHDYLNRWAEAVDQLVEWNLDGRIKTRQDVRYGLENALISFRDLYRGRNFGKLLLEITPK